LEGIKNGFQEGRKFPIFYGGETMVELVEHKELDKMSGVINIKDPGKLVWIYHPRGWGSLNASSILQMR
jgi:hypothetical protein